MTELKWYDMLWILLLLVLIAALLNQTLESHKQRQPEPLPPVITDVKLPLTRMEKVAGTSGRLYEFTRPDGQRCILYLGDRSAGLSCDWHLTDSGDCGRIGNEVNK